MIELKHGDCLDIMPSITDGSIDMILCDLPYGTTACKWDVVIPFDKLWTEYNRVIKKGGCIALFGSEPFSSYLRMSNINNYKYDWYLEKNWNTGHLNAHFQPMRKIEVCTIFNSKSYNPQGLKIYGKIKNRYASSPTNQKSGTVNFQKYTNYPSNLIEFKRDQDSMHPTQKPVALLEYLIKTYTLENETILDNTMGSGSTGVACVNTKRNFIGIEKVPNYFNIAKQRIEDAQAQGTLF